jgi:hypothetical protein
MSQQPKPAVASLAFFDKLRWLDGRPLLDTIEPYRRRLFTAALDTFRPDGSPVHNLVVSGRAKKNGKTCDLVLAALYCTVIRRRSMQGNDALILASDEDQAGDDLSLARKLVDCNPELRAEFQRPLVRELRLRDGGGSIRVLPAKDVAGAHGKTFGFCGHDEIHTARNWDLLESLQPDPSRADALTWITSYDTIYNTPGVPLVDLKAIGKAGTDPRMLFSWYSGDLCTDPDFADLEPELRANPSMDSWPEGREYLVQQKRRLPTHKYRRLHLNLPGAPNGAFLDQGAVLGAIVSGQVALPPQPGTRYVCFVDMSGGSNDDATLAVGHKAADGRVVVDLVVSQAGSPPFNPRSAVKKFAAIIKGYGASEVVGDNYAGETFKQDFEAERIRYVPSPLTATELYEAFEPRLNAGEIDLPDVAKLQEQLLTLVIRGARIGHQSGDHDDWANAVAGCVWRLTAEMPAIVFTHAMVAAIRQSGRGERARLQAQRRRGY